MRRKNKKYAWLYWIPTSILIAVLVFSCVRAVQVYIPQRRDQNSIERLRREIPSETAENTDSFVNRYASVMAQNSDFACWLKIPDSVVDYPVMKTSEDDPEFYLRRGFDKKYSSAGCLFIGGGCNLDSDSFIIYGHNMDAGTMFGQLDRYMDPDYAREHRLIFVGTPTEDRFYRVFAVFQTRIFAPEDDVFKYYEQIGSLDEPDYRDTVTHVRSMSMYDMTDVPQYPAQLLFLSTCSYHTQEGRFVVAAYRTDADE